MKKLLLFCLLAISPYLLQAQVIWSGEKDIDWSSTLGIDATKFANADIADRLVFNIRYVGNNDWPQVSLTTPSWSGVPGAGNTLIYASTTQVVYAITSDMLTTLTEQGLLVTGCGYTLLSIEIEKGPGASGYENAIWIGEVVLPSDWSGSVSIPALSFKNASLGDKMRIHVKDVKPGSLILPKNASWGDIADAPGKTAEGVYVDYDITETLLQLMKTDGLIIQGVNATITSIDIIKAQTGDRVTAAVPVTHNWTWLTGEEPSIRISLKNPTAEAKSVSYKLLVTTDKLENVKNISGSTTVEAGGTKTEDVPVSGLSSGFYHITVTVDGEMIRAFNIGIDPEGVVSAPDMQPDFAAFWQQALTDLSAVEPRYQLTKIDSKSTDKRTVYLVEMKSVADGTGSDITIRGYYAEPTGSGTYPAIIHYQGYDSGTADPWCMGGNDNPGWCELILSTRGQVINNRPPYTNAYGDWFAYGMDHQDHFYYRGAYMDVVRAIDFMASREKVQQQNIFAEGASQGGAFTLAAAALDKRLNSIAPGIPFMGDFPDYFELASWPGNVAKNQKNKLGMSEAEMYRVLSYFDTKNLATMITCPVIMNFSLQDNVCPPHTNVAPYNNLASTEKEYSVNATLGHETSGSWWNTYFQFFRDHFKTADAISEINAQSDISNGAIYNLQGQRVAETRESLPILPQGVYIVNGNKVMKK